MPQNFTSRTSLERRAIVAIACYFLVAQVFLAGLALGFSASDLRGGAAAFICHGAGAAASGPAGSEKSTKPLCGLCALAGTGNTLLPAPADFAPVVRVFTRFVAPAELDAGPSPFRARAGRARAPPIFV